MRKYMMSVMVVGCALCMIASLVFAQDEELSPIAKKVKGIVEAAHAFVSEHSDDMAAVQKAFEEDPRFRDDENGLYIFMHCYNAEKEEAICCGQGENPALVGKNMWNLRTPSGRLLFHEEVELIEKYDEFWLEYDWLNPKKQIQTKHSFFKKIVLKDGRNAWIGCGYWKD